MDILFFEEEQRMISVNDLTVKYGDTVVVEDVSFEVRDGSWLMITGPNGAGKSTIIKAVSQGIPYTGSVKIDGQDASKMKSRDLARKIGVLSQEHYVGYGFTVEEVIRLGLYSRRGKSLLSRSGGSEDSGSEVSSQAEEAFSAAVSMCGLEPYLKQSVLKLSGGELQRTFLAQLFAQDPQTLILDEPTNHLDLVYQKQIMELIDRWRLEKGRTVVSAIHDLSLARMFGTDAMIIDRGKVFSRGSAAEVLNSENLDPVYGMDVAAWIRSTQEVWN